MLKDEMLESFPFDSSPVVEYDEWGYPRFDRAVGARTMRETFAKFFSDGVFPNPGSELILSKGDGLSVKVGAGGCIINGAFGIVREPRALKLAEGPTKGTAAYAVMARFDDTEAHRCIRFRVVKGEAGPSPAPPEPEKGTPDVVEYRMGYVVVPNGATDLSEARVVNEKGLSSWPYAAPFERIDVSGIVEDFRANAGEAYDRFAALLDEYMKLLESAVDGTAAGHLQNQIAALKKAVDELKGAGLTDEAFSAYVFEGVN